MDKGIKCSQDNLTTLVTIFEYDNLGAAMVIVMMVQGVGGGVVLLYNHLTSQEVKDYGN